MSDSELSDWYSWIQTWCINRWTNSRRSYRRWPPWCICQSKVNNSRAQRRMLLELSTAAGMQRGGFRSGNRSCFVSLLAIPVKHLYSVGRCMTLGSSIPSLQSCSSHVLRGGEKASIFEFDVGSEHECDDLPRRYTTPL